MIRLHIRDLLHVVHHLHHRRRRLLMLSAILLPQIVALPQVTGRGIDITPSLTRKVEDGGPEPGR